MDRRTIYPGQVPLETDLLYAQQYAMIGLAEFCQTVLGTPTLVDSFTVTPTTPASLNVVLTPGNVYQMEDLEATTWSSVQQNLSNTIMKQGILLNAQTLGITPPTTFGYSQVYLMEVAYSDFDTGAVVLPYYNAANPAEPFSGPGNAGSANNTIRHGQASFQLKAGTPAPTGTQVAPTADPGWVGIYTITVANGAQTITSGNIAQLATAPFLATLGHLPQIPNGVQNWQWSFCTDTGTTNAWVGTVAPIPLGLTPGLSVRVKVKNAVTGATTFNLNGLGNVAVNRANGSALQSGDVNANMVADLVYDGSAWQLVNFEGFTSTTTNNNTFTLSIPYCQDTGTVNAVVAPFSPALVSVSAGNIIEVQIAHTNTGATTIVINSLASAPIVDLFDQPLSAGMIQSGEVALMIYTGSAWQLVNGPAGGGLTNVQVFTSSGTYTPTVGANKALVFATGGGGGGECGCGAGQGGGGGATAVALVSLTGVASVAVTIGAGGVGTANAETSGGATSFGTYAVAGGGFCGNCGGGVVGPNESGNGTGGTATAGILLIRGGAGGGQYTVQNGDGGSSFWGDGGRGQLANGASAGIGEINAHVYGGGGGGTDYPGQNTAGSGMSGLVLVLEF